MEILQEAVNKTIAELFDIMDVFEYEDSFDVQFGSFASPVESDIFAGESDFFSDLFVNPEEVKKKQTEQDTQTKERKKLYAKMNECYLNLVNEYLMFIRFHSIYPHSGTKWDFAESEKHSKVPL